jgi:ubiquinone/menaquinone biosynthesis C-methylase UbiE
VVIDRVHPETAFGEFTRFDGTIAFFNRVQALLKPNMQVVDMGCGRGAYQSDPSEYRRRIRMLGGDGRRVIGLDIDPAASVHPFIDEFRLITDVKRWPLDDSSADMLVADFVLEHVAEPELFFAEVRRVLKPGGFCCFRTPNKWFYVSVLARLIPNRHHAKAVGMVQDNRESQDVFPTYYRCNTRPTLTRLMEGHRLSPVVYLIEPEPGYLQFSSLVYNIGAVVHRLLPPKLRSTVLAFGQKL